VGGVNLEGSDVGGHHNQRNEAAVKKSRTGSVTGEGLASPPVATVQLPLWDAVTPVREGFFALCIATGQQVLAAPMEHDRQPLCGPKNVPNP
jgi:hypothetical protein